MAMAAQRRIRRRSDGDGDGGAAMGVAVVAAAADVHRPPLFACGCSSAAPDGRPPLFATDVRDVFCIFLLSLHIFNVGIPYTQTDDRRQFNHFSFGSAYQLFYIFFKHLLIDQRNSLCYISDF
jgi:hypothetical protein